MEGYKSKGGVGLLELALGKLYHNPKVIFREYIQNACDGLEEAVEKGIIKDDEKQIVININRSRHQIVFEDKGIGVEESKIGETLVDIGSSKKIFDPNLIGQYGIGRLIAARYCDKIIFETSYQGESTMSTLVWDTKKALELIDKRQERDFLNIIDEVTTKLPNAKEEADKHYFRVTLENVNDFDLLDEEIAYRYIAQTAPIDFTFEFKDEMLKPALEEQKEYAELMSKERNYHIKLNDREIRKLYEDHFGEVEMTMPKFFCIEDFTYGKMAWGWYSLPKTITEMNDYPARGIRLRKMNMAIGLESIITEYFPKPVDAFHFVGEIYLIHKDIEPSGSRDGIGVSNVAGVFKTELTNKCHELHDLYTKVYRNGYNLGKKIADTFVSLQKDKVQLATIEDQNKRRELKAGIEEKSTELQSLCNEFETRKQESKKTVGAEELFKATEEQINKRLEDKIEKHNSAKTREQRAKIKVSEVASIAQEFAGQNETETVTGVIPAKEDKASALKPKIKEVYLAVKEVIDSESILPEKTKKEILEKILNKISKK